MTGDHRPLAAGVHPSGAARVRRRVTGAALAVTLVLWASAFVAIRIAVREYRPGPLALFRFLVASAAIGAYALLAPGQGLASGPVPSPSWAA